MFCGSCGSKTLVGDRFCNTCGQAHRSPSATESVAVPVLLEESATPDVESRAVDQAASAGVPVTQPVEKPLYCRHSPSERGALGGYGQDGSEICMDCRLPYEPGSPGSGLRPAVGRSGPLARPGEKSVFWSPKVLGPIAALVLALGLVWAYEGSQWAGQQSGSDATSSGADPAVQAAACARVATLASQIKDVKEQEHQAFLSGGGAPAYEPFARQWRTLDVERIAQDKVCKG